MATHILRPTPVKGTKRERHWLLRGTWGERQIEPMSKVGSG
jgi:hypothetical protein